MDKLKAIKSSITSNYPGTLPKSLLEPVSIVPEKIVLGKTDTNSKKRPPEDEEEELEKKKKVKPNEPAETLPLQLYILYWILRDIDEKFDQLMDGKGKDEAMNKMIKKFEEHKIQIDRIDSDRLSVLQVVKDYLLANSNTTTKRIHDFLINVTPNIEKMTIEKAKLTSAHTLYFSDEHQKQSKNNTSNDTYVITIELSGPPSDGLDEKRLDKQGENTIKLFEKEKRAHFVHSIVKIATFIVDIAKQYKKTSSPKGVNQKTVMSILKFLKTENIERSIKEFKDSFFIIKSFLDSEQQEKMAKSIHPSWLISDN